MKPDLWRHVVGRFRGFVDDLRTNPEEVRLAVAAADRIVRAAATRLVPATGAAHLPRVIIGGCAKGTSLGSGTTADALFVLPDVWRRVEARRIAGEIVTALADADIEATPETIPWTAVAAIADGRRARLIPAFACAAGGFVVNDASGNRRHCDPAEELAALRRADRISRDKATHLVLMAKAWRSARGVDLPAFAIELLVEDFLSVWTYPRRSLYFYDWMVRDFFFWLSHQGNRILAIPGTFETVSVGDAWAAEAAAAHYRAEQACRLERDNRSDQAFARWQQVFGPWIAGQPRTAALPSPEPAGPPPRRSVA